MYTEVDKSKKLKQRIGTRKLVIVLQVFGVLTWKNKTMCICIHPSILDGSGLGI